jgi:hypothetical protein
MVAGCHHDGEAGRLLSMFVTALLSAASASVGGGFGVLVVIE